MVPPGYPKGWTPVDAVYRAGEDEAPEVWTPGWRFLVNDYAVPKIKYATAPGAEEAQIGVGNSDLEWGNNNNNNINNSNNIIFTSAVGAWRLKDAQVDAGAGDYEV